MGYSVTGDNTSAPFRELAYSAVSYMGLSIEYRLQHLSADEENILRTVYLQNLTTLESAIVGASDNLDTDQAAVWSHNRNEVRDRKSLFDEWRRRLCDFLGFPGGSGLKTGLQLVRC